MEEERLKSRILHLLKIMQVEIFKQLIEKNQINETIDYFVITCTNYMQI